MVKRHLQKLMRAAFFLACANTAAVAQSGPACSVPPYHQAQLQQVLRPGAGTRAFIGIGLLWIEDHCPQQARTFFNQAKVEAANSPQDQSAVDLLLKITDGLQAWQGGDIPKATQLLKDTSDDGMPETVRGGSVYLYAELLVSHPDDNAWKDLKPKLTILSDKGLWRARLFLIFYHLPQDGPASHIAQLQWMLDQDLPTEDRLTDLIFMVELFRSAGRLHEAELLAKNIDSEVGLKVLPTDLRFFYLQICANLAANEEMRGDALAGNRKMLYLKAIGDFHAP